MAASGFLLAASHFDRFSSQLLLELCLGMALIIASACVFNNYIDRGIDKKMTRTNRRALVTKRISGPAAITYAAILGIIGFGILAFLTNLVVFCLNLAAYLMYIVVYGWAKRHSEHGTLVGSIPGAIPPAAGFVAVSGRLDRGAATLFLIMVFWQVAHFYAITVYRKRDYQSAGLPMMSIKRGVSSTKTQTIVYIWLFATASIMLTVFDYTGYIYLAFVIGLSAYWLWLGQQKLKDSGDKMWGKRMFRYSLIVLSSMAVLIPLGSVLP